MTPKRGFVLSGILLLIASITATVCVFTNTFSEQMQKITNLMMIVSVILMIISARKKLIYEKRGKEKEMEWIRNVFGKDDTIDYN